MSILRLEIKINYAQCYKGLCMEEKCQFVINIEIYIYCNLGAMRGPYRTATKLDTLRTIFDGSVIQ